MTNAEIAQVFEDIAGLLELEGSLRYKVRAYRRAASTIQKLPTELEQLRREGRLDGLPGIGREFQRKIEELLDTGHLEFLDRVRARASAEPAALAEAPAVAAKVPAKATNTQIMKALEDIGALLELKKDSPFKIRAYQRAARTVQHLPVELAQLRREGPIKGLPGIGEAIADKIEELLDGGRLGYLERLRAEFPPGVSALVAVPSVGPKRALLIAKELSISTVDELEQAVLDGRVASLPRMGAKTAENILRHIDWLRHREERIPIGMALPAVDDILAGLRDCPCLRQLTPAGSVRRLAETVHDIDIIGAADDPSVVLGRFVNLPQVRSVLAHGPQRASAVLHSGIQVDLRLMEHESFGSLLQHFTGSKQHNVDLREWAVKHGLSLSEYGVTNVETGELERFSNEEDFYARLGMQWIPPEIREGGEEIDLALRHALPRLVEVSDIKGDLHVHTKWSDGRKPLEDMIEAARARGYEYLAITEHSVGRGIAQGLTPDRLREQIGLIRAANEASGGLRVLAGTEVDIRSDGSLDFPDELLAQLDIVVASVHSAMGQPREVMTERVIRAIRNPHVHILGHPTCRLLGERQPVEIDLEDVFKEAAKTGTAVEINANPYRLDLKDTHIKLARKLGVSLVISTDAHAPEHYDFMRFGVGMARRGWCEPRDILNTLPLAELLARLHWCG